MSSSKLLESVSKLLESVSKLLARERKVTSELYRTIYSIEVIHQRRVLELDDN